MATLVKTPPDLMHAAVLTTTVTTIVLLAISFFLKKQGHAASGDAVEALLGTYGPLADGRTTVTNQ
jgi:hypothetical protein